MVSSLDGFIAKEDNSISWFETSSRYADGLPLENNEDILNAIDCYIMGSHTYELAEELSKNYGWPYGDKTTYVLSHRQLKTERTNVKFYSGDLPLFVESELKGKYQNIWLVGGSNLCKEFLQHDLLDEIKLSILPILLGGGLLFFDFIAKELCLNLMELKAYNNGMVELSYSIKKRM
ncbi:MAG: dihydrofolate reductase family protein [Chitinophagales bacterium]